MRDLKFIFTKLARLLCNYLLVISIYKVQAQNIELSYFPIYLVGNYGKSIHFTQDLTSLKQEAANYEAYFYKVNFQVQVPPGYNKIAMRLKGQALRPHTVTIKPHSNESTNVKLLLNSENNYTCIFPTPTPYIPHTVYLYFDSLQKNIQLHFFAESTLQDSIELSHNTFLKKPNTPSLAPLSNNNNFTCDRASCVGTNKEYTNRNRPGCGSCTDVWLTPPVGNSCDWIQMDNPVFFQFELLQDKIVTITLDNIICSGGGGKLQVGLWHRAACQPGNLGATGFITCASDSHRISITQSLRAGSYLLVADGDSRSECTWRFTSNIPFLTATSNSVFTDSLKNHICEGENLELRVLGAHPSATYLWQGPGSFSSTLAAPTRANALATHSGLYTVIVTPGPGSICTQPETLTTQVNIKPRPMLMLQDTILKRCVGQSVTFLASATPEAKSFTWRGPNNFTSNQLTVTLTNLTTTQGGTYFITARNDSTRCSTTKSLSLEVFNVPSLPFVTSRSISRCGSGWVEIEAAMGNLAGNVLYLYNQPQGGEILAQDSIAPFILRTPILEPGNYTFYVASAFKSTGCQSRRTPANVTVNPNIPLPVVNSTHLRRCGNGPVTFTAQMGTPIQANEIQLYTESSGNSTPIAQDNSAPYELVTPPLSPGNYTFYIISTNTVTGCQSAAVPVTVRVFPAISAPVVPNPPTPRCGAGPVTISANMGATPGNQIRVYTSLIQTNPLLTRNTPPYELTIPNLTSSTTFYLTAIDTNTSCESTRLEIQATIFTLPLTPRPNNSLVANCLGGSVSFIDSRNLSDTEMRLYSVPIGGTPIATDNQRPFELTVNNLTTDATFYMESVAISSGCINPNRVQVRALAVQNPGRPNVQGDTLCGSGQGEIRISPTPPIGSAIAIYTQSTGGTPLATLNTPPYLFITPNTTQTTTYFIEAINEVSFLGVDCRSERVPATVVVNRLPAEPNVGNFSRCEAGNVRIVASFADAEADLLRIFSTPQGGEPILSVSALPLTFQLNVNQTTIYYALAENSVTGCTSQRVPFVVTVNPEPGIPNAAAVSSCGSGMVTFTAIMGSPPASRFLLYETNTGGTPIASTSLPPYELPVFITTTTQFFLEAISAQGCTSGRKPVLATLRERPGQPFAEGVARCGAGEVIFTVSMGVPAGNEVRIYSQISEGSALDIDNSFPFLLKSSSITTTTTFYIESLQGNGCKSVRTPVIATILPVPGPPSVPVQPSRCGGGRILFTAQMGTPPANTIRLYTPSASGYSLIEEDDIPLYEFLSPFLTTNTLLYIESYNSATGCTSPKVGVPFIIHPFPSPPLLQDMAICAPQAVAFTVNLTSGSEARLYSVPTGGAILDIANFFPYRLTTPVVSLTTTFYVESYDANTTCSSLSRSPIVIRVENRPRIPISQRISRCGTGSVIFNDTLQATTGISLRLYTQPLGGEAITSDATFPYAVSTPIVTTTTTFYLGFFNAINNCEGDRQEVVALIHPKPGMPESDSIEACGTGQVLIIASQGTPAGNQMAIYDNPFSNNPLATIVMPPFNFQFQDIGSSKTFYLESIDSNTGCKSDRKPIAIKLLPSPGTPRAPDILLCSPAPTTLTVFMGEPAGDEILLYTTPIGSVPIARDSTFPDFLLRTPLISTHTTLYIASFNKVSRCESARYPVKVFVSLPAPPTVSTQERCGGGRVTFFVSGGFYDEVRLYDVAFGGSPITTDNSSLYRLETPIITTSTTFYVTAIVGGCETVRVQAIALVQPLPPLPLVANTSRCGRGAITFTAQLSGSANEVRVYELPTGGLPLAQATSFPYVLNIPTIQTTTTFYFETIDTEQKCVSGGRSMAIAVIHPIPGTPMVSSTARCGTGILTFSVTMQSPFGDEIRLYTLPLGSAPVNFTNIFPYRITTPAITTTTTFYLESYNTQTGCRSPMVESRAIIQPQPAIPMVADTHRCASGPGVFRARMQIPAGNQMRLYATESGGLPFAISNGPSEYFLTTPPVTSHTQFYIEALDTLTGCTSLRATARLVIHALPGTPNVVEGYLCGKQNVAFTVNMGIPRGTEVRLFATPTGGLPIITDNSEPYILTTSPITTITTFFIESYHSGTGCASALRQQVIASPAPGNPIVPIASRCGSGKVTFLPAISPPAGDIFRLYTTPSGGNPIATDGVAPYELSSIEIRENTTFYIELLNSATGCVSDRVPAEAIVLPLPGAPFAQDVARCGSGKVFFSVIPGAGSGNEFRLYASPSSPAPLAVDLLFPFELETPAISTNTVFYIEPRDANTGCIGERIPVRAIVYPLPPAPVLEKPFICAGSITQLVVLLDTRFANEALLFDSPSTNLPLLPPDNTPPYEFWIPASPANTTYYVAARNSTTGCISRPNSVEVLPLPGTPFAENISRCGNGSATFTAQMGSPAGDIIRLYSVPASGVALHSTGNSPYLLPTPGVSTSTIFYLESVQQNTGCTSARTPVILSIHPLPEPATVEPVSRCDVGPVTFSPQPSLNLGTSAIITLYSLPSGSLPLATDATEPYELTTPTLSTNTTFYVQVTDGRTGCLSALSLAIAEVFPLPAPPSANNVFLCEPSTIQLTAFIPGEAPGNQVFLYDAPSSGILVASAFSRPYLLRTPLITTNTTYWLESRNTLTGCTSASRSEVRITMAPKPGIPFAENQSRCGPSLFTFTAFMRAPWGNVLRFYDSPTSNFPIASATSEPYLFITPLITTTTTYYIENFNSTTGCKSARFAVVAEILPLPGIPEASDLTRCTKGRTFILANMGNPPGDEIRLYHAGGALLSTDATPPYELETPNLTTTTIFWIESRNTRTGCVSGRKQVTVQINSAPPAPTIASNSPICEKETLRLTATGISGATYVWLGPNGFSATGNSLILPNAKPSNSGTYSAIAILGGCTSEFSTLHVVIRPQPSISTLEANSPVCLGDTLRLSTHAIWGASYIWLGPDNFSASGAQVKIPNAQLQNAGVYSLIQILNQCSSEVFTLQVTVSSPNATFSTSSQAVCAETPVTFNIRSSGNYPLRFIYLANTIRNTEILEQPSHNFSSSFNAPTTIVPELVVDALGCTTFLAPTAIQITVYSRPTARIISTPRICAGSAASINFVVERAGSNNWLISYLEGATPKTITGTGNGVFRITTSPLSANTPLQFLSIRNTDDNCTRTLQDTSARTVISVLPYPILQVSSNPSCENDTAKIILSLSGRAPWFLQWEENGQFRSTTIGNSETPSPHQFILQPILNQNTVFRFSLLRDATGCQERNLPTYTQIVNPRPTAAFDATTKAVCSGSNVQYNLLLTGKAPWQIEYTVNNSLRAPLELGNPSILGPQIFAFTLPLLGDSLITLTRVQDALGCRATELPSLFLRAKPIPLPPREVSSNTPVCEGTTLQLSATGIIPPATYLWQGPNGFFSSAATSQISNVTLNDGGVYSVTALLEGCASMPITVTVRVLPAPPIPVFNLPSTICQTQNINLTAPTLPEVEFLWSASNGWRARGEQQTLQLAPGTYSFSLTATSTANLCTSKVFSRQIIVDPLPSVKLPTEGFLLCAGQNAALPIELIGAPPFTLRYRIGMSPTIIVNSIGQSPYLLPYSSANPENTSLIIEQIQDQSACRSSLTATSTRIQVFNPPALQLVEIEHAQCGLAGGRVRLQAVGGSGNNAFVYFREGSSIENSTGIFEQLRPGIYTFGVKEGLCQSSLRVEIFETPPPSPFITAITYEPATASNTLWVAWSRVEGASHYNLRYRAQGTTLWITLPLLIGTEKEITGLLPNTTYEFSVQAVCANGNASGFSEVRSASTATVPSSCATPSLQVRDRDVPNGNIGLIWNTIQQASCYEINYGLITAPETWISIFRNVPQTSLNLNLPSGSYGFRIRAHCGGCPARASDWSAIERITIPSFKFGTSLEDPEITLYPNPAQESFTITGLLENSNQTPLELHIYNSEGRKIISKEIWIQGKSELSIDISKLEPGYYLVELTGNNLSKNFKLIKH
ncbi:MAG: T9SS type A sorting domain-containing protein [Bacteroidia bacterium]|nr:T9SS type A sorting domain-containing protein [Bacteroidia bacterium]